MNYARTDEMKAHARHVYNKLLFDALLKGRDTRLAREAAKRKADNEHRTSEKTI